MKHLTSIILGLMLGIALTFSPGGVFVCALYLATLYCIKVCADTVSRDFLVKLFIVGFGIRVIFTLINYTLGLTLLYSGTDTQPDALIYNTNAFYIANILRGPQFFTQFLKDPFLMENLQIPYQTYNGSLPVLGEYQYNVYVHILGIVYSWLGYSPVAVRLINCIFGALSALLIYLIAKIVIKSEKGARLSAIITMFMPSLVYWSVTLLQDTLVNFLFLLYVFSLLAFFAKNKTQHIFTAFIALVFLGIFKGKVTMLFVVGFLLIVAIKLLMNMTKVKALTRIVIILCIVAASLLIALAYKPAILNIISDKALSIARYHIGATTHRTASVFRIYPMPIYHIENLTIENLFDLSLLFSIAKSIFYYFFSPFPWYIPYSHIGLLVFYPQVIFMFVMIPFVVLGILAALRRNLSITLLVTFLLGFILLPLAMAEGVIGNVVRHRDMFMPFIFMFASYGFYIAVSPKEKAST